MGTDIFIGINGTFERKSKVMNETRKKGYLRASIHMQSENAILREIFPSETYWTNKIMTKDVIKMKILEKGKKKYVLHSIKYDFIKNKEKNQKIIQDYIEILSKGGTIKHKDEADTKEVINAISKAIKGLGAEIQTPNTPDYKEFAKEVTEFLSFGEKMQKKGNKVGVFISH